MYTLCINDKNNQTQPWWLNFLFSLSRYAGITDLSSELKKWGATIVHDRHGYSDTILFDKEEDLVWFLLKWT
jgi:hypothetical protein